jgi:CRISPR-associated protein Csm4
VKLYEVIIKPESGFGTPLKGDTIFGHICWQTAYDKNLLEGGLDRWINCYAERPFVVCSSAWPKIRKEGKWFYAMKRPDYPPGRLFQSTQQNCRKALEQKKDNLKRKWLLVSEDLLISLSADKFISNEELLCLAFQELTGQTKKAMRKKTNRQFMTEFIQPHNTINRLTMTTGSGMFAPHSEAADFYYPETELAIFILVDEEATDMDRLQAAMERIGRVGYGRNASTGAGKFSLGECEEKALPNTAESDACYNLAPVLPEIGLYKEFWFTPFTRFGRHGDTLAASKNPFKNPVIMLDEGAILIPSDRSVFSKPYLGRPAGGVSKVLPGAIAQGYSIYLPFKLEK